MADAEQRCVFCRIVAGTGPVSLVYEDDLVLVFPTLHPVNQGHLFIVPKRHCETLQDLDEPTAAHAMTVAKRMAAAIRASGVKCEGINLFVADGEPAGQEVPHFHLHVYPRYQGDGFGFRYDQDRHFVQIDRNQMDMVAAEIRAHL